MSPTSVAYGLLGDQENGNWAVLYPANDSGITSMRKLTRVSPKWNQKSFIVQYNIGSYRNGTNNRGELYLGGVRIEDNNTSSYGGLETAPYLLGHSIAAGNVTSFTIVCGAFYSRWLTSVEVSHIYEQAAAL